VPPQTLVWHESDEPQVATDPPEQMPSAPAAPQPTQYWPVMIWLGVQVSGQVPSVVKQPPEPALQAAWQHWLAAPVVQDVCAAVQVQGLQVSELPLQ
jgi:hypothetical protein